MRVTLLLPGIMSALAVSVVAQAAQPDDEGVAQEIAQAETAVRRAAAHKALWTSAEDALAMAKKNLAEGKISQARAPAALAKELAELGIAQTAYPLFSE